MAKDKQINLRATDEQLDLISRGAELAGMSRSAFMLRAAEALARNLLTKSDER